MFSINCVRKERADKRETEGRARDWAGFDGGMAGGGEEGGACASMSLGKYLNHKNASRFLSTFYFPLDCRLVDLKWVLPASRTQSRKSYR